MKSSEFNTVCVQIKCLKCELKALPDDSAINDTSNKVLLHTNGRLNDSEPEKRTKLNLF